MYTGIVQRVKINGEYKNGTRASEPNKLIEIEDSKEEEKKKITEHHRSNISNGNKSNGNERTESLTWSVFSSIVLAYLYSILLPL